MPNNPLFYDGAVISAVNAAASQVNNGFLNIYSGGQPALDGGLSGVLLVQLAFGGTAFASATASGGTVTALANSIGNGTAVATGTAGYYALLESDGMTVVQTGVCGTSGSDLNMSTTAIVSGAIVTCSSYAITQAQT